MGANGGPKGFLAASDGCERKSGPIVVPKTLGCCGAPKGPGAEGWPKVEAGIEGLLKVENDCPKLVVGWPSVEGWPKAEGWLG